MLQGTVSPRKPAPWKTPHVLNTPKLFKSLSQETGWHLLLSHKMRACTMWPHRVKTFTVYNEKATLIAAYREIG